MNQPAAQRMQEILGGTPVMAILRGYAPDRTVELANRAWDLGVQSVEVPVQTAEAAAALAATVRSGAARGRTVGAGTVTTVARLEAAVAAGAAFAVSPGVDEDVIRASLDLGLPYLPGVYTATDVQTCLRLGLTWLKAFPATHLGTGWFSAMRGPFPEVSFVATGGITAANAEAFLDAGASMVAVGSALESEDQLPLLAAIVKTRGATAGDGGQR
jgi:2-dehydro-3-deoxyphosphogluconate aldolase/(4S)-4-hydroxy-2-oxoglutarate aldolase